MPRTTVVRHDHAQDHANACDLALVDDFGHALQTGGLVLHYQPKATLVSARVDAVEALVFWRHPQLGLLGPDRFVPLVEQTDLIDQLTKWVLCRALDDLRGLGRRAEHVTMAVNVSARNISGPGFAGLVERSLIRAQISPVRLVLEITEAALLSDPEGARGAIASLAALGVNVSIDDFGRGRTPYGYLSTLPIRELKIDRGFIGDMLVNPAHAAIVRSIVDLGHDLQLRVAGDGCRVRCRLGDSAGARLRLGAGVRAGPADARRAARALAGELGPRELRTGGELRVHGARGVGRPRVIPADTALVVELPSAPPCSPATHLDAPA